MICPSCRKPNADGARFCNDCGAALPPSPEDSDFTTPAVAGRGGSRPKDERPDPLIGRTLDGKYRLDAKLGSGGMGSVYAAARVHIGDTVAIKVLHLGQSADPHSAERFRREARATARLKHPNAVGIYDFGVTDDGLHYLVMELVEGQNLRVLIKQQGPLSPPTTLEVITQVCAALDEAHRQSIVHRDVKPDNVIVNATASGLRVKVLDFGVAKLCDLTTGTELTQTGSVIGTPHYMSPEQCVGEEADVRSDIYSLGVVLYEMLCGVVPFNAPSSVAVVMQHINQPPPPPRAKNVNITPAVEAVMLHALEKRREARPQSAGALAQELAAAVYGRDSAEQPRPTRMHHAPTTSPDAPFAPGLATTLFTPSPESGERYAAPAGGPHYYSRPVPPAPPRRKLPALALGAALLLVIAGGTIGVVAWLQKGVVTDQPASSVQLRAFPEREPATGKPQKQQTETITAADAEFIKLSERRHHATDADHAEIAGDLKVAEAKYPVDYRFPYEHAKMEVNDPPPHDEVISLLFTAGRKAIDAGKADEMLSDLVKEEGHEFGEFSADHKRQWKTLLEALRGGDKSELKVEHSH